VKLSSLISLFKSFFVCVFFLSFWDRVDWIGRPCFELWACFVFHSLVLSLPSRLSSRVLFVSSCLPTVIDSCSPCLECDSFLKPCYLLSSSVPLLLNYKFRSCSNWLQGQRQVLLIDGVYLSWPELPKVGCSFGVLLIIFCEVLAVPAPSSHCRSKKSIGVSFGEVKDKSILLTSSWSWLLWFLYSVVVIIFWSRYFPFIIVISFIFIHFSNYVSSSFHGVVIEWCSTFLAYVIESSHNSLSVALLSSNCFLVFELFPQARVLLQADLGNNDVNYDWLVSWPLQFPSTVCISEFRSFESGVIWWKLLPRPGELLHSPWFLDLISLFIRSASAT